MIDWTVILLCPGWLLGCKEDQTFCFHVSALHKASAVIKACEELSNDMDLGLKEVEENCTAAAIFAGHLEDLK